MNAKSPRSKERIIIDMKKQYLVAVSWIAAQDGGRKDSGLNMDKVVDYYYCTTILDYTPPTWSIKIKPIKNSSNKFHLSFLFDHYPDIIYVNDIIPLYEGPKIVGHALITDIIDTDINVDNDLYD